MTESFTQNGLLLWTRYSYLTILYVLQAKFLMHKNRHHCYDVWQRSFLLFASNPSPQETLITPPVHLQYWFINNIVEIPLVGGRGNISTVHVAILTRWGVSIFKMPPSTAATVNQFPNPKVSNVEKEGEGEEGQGGHLLFLIRMDQSTSPSLSFFISVSLVLSLFLSSLYPPTPPPLSVSLCIAFWVASKGFKWHRGGLSLQNVTLVKQGPTHGRVFPLHHQLVF